MLAPRQHHPTERDHVQLCNGVPNDGEGFLTHRPIRRYVIGRVDVALVDLIFWNELVDVDGAGALDLNGFYFLILDKHVLAFGDLVAAHHVFPGDNFASLGIDVLLLQPVARFPVDPIKNSLFRSTRRPDRVQWGKRPAKAEGTPSSSHAAPLDTPKQYATGKLYRKL